MKCNRIFSTILALVVFGFLAANSAHATDWTITQLTNNSYTNSSPQIHGSHVVWYGGVTLAEREIFLYDGNSTTNISNNSYWDKSPQIYGSNVVWAGHPSGTDEEILLYDGESITQLDNKIGRAHV